MVSRTCEDVREGGLCKNLEGDNSNAEHLSVESEENLDKPQSR
jgi:hypothetical protein